MTSTSTETKAVDNEVSALSPAHLVVVAPELIDDNPWQPRILRNKADDAVLTESIARDTLFHPPIARLVAARYQIGMGHRRKDSIIALSKPRTPAGHMTASSSTFASTTTFRRRRGRSRRTPPAHSSAPSRNCGPGKG